MGRFDAFEIELLSLQDGVYEYEFKLDNTFFKNIDSEEIRKGNLTAKVRLTKSPYSNEFVFAIDGIVFAPCDRCLDDVEIEVHLNQQLSVKFGAGFSEEDDHTITIPESEASINLSWFMYEFIELSLPLKRIHPAGKCNKGMSSKLNKHLAVANDDDADTDIFPGDEELSEVENEIDPRWSKLKELNIEND